MRFLFVLASILSFSVMSAQRGGGGQGGGARGGNSGAEQQQRKEITFEAAKAAGIFNYDDVEAIKKIKIKKKDEALILNVRQGLERYNNKVNEIALLNKDNFDTINVYMNTVIKESRSIRSQNRETGSYGSMERGEEDQNSAMSVARKLSKEKIDPAKKAIKIAEEKLNADMEGLLSEKQYTKWLKYQVQVKEELNPKPESKSSSDVIQSQGGGRQGGGSRGGGRMR